MNTTERLANFLWQQAGCPDGRSDEFWYKAEKLWQKVLCGDFENLKLPLCPSCHETKRVTEIGFWHCTFGYEWYSCKDCDIFWNYCKNENIAEMTKLNFCMDISHKELI